MSTPSSDQSTTTTPTGPQSGRRKSSRQYKRKLELNEEVLRKGIAGMNKALKDLGQTKPSTPRDLFKINQATASLKSESTKDSYVQVQGELLNFFLLIGDYQSALLVNDNFCPKSPPPFRPDDEWWCFFMNSERR